MALSKLEPNAERVDKIARRMKEIIEATWLRDPELNGPETEEFKRLREEIENMGLFVHWEARFNLDDPENPRIETDINVWMSRNTTIH